MDKSVGLGPIILSAYGEASSRPSPVGRMMAAFAADFRDGIDINLGVGYVNEQTIPRDLIREALTVVLANPQRYRVALNYGGPAGSPNLIHSLRQFLLSRRGTGIDERLLAKNRIIIGPCGATSLLESVAHLLPPGIVVTSDPVYYIYCELLERLGFEILPIPEDEQGLSASHLREALRALGDRLEGLRFFYVVTVNNPTCRILSTDRRRELVQIAGEVSLKLGRRVPIFFDLAYEFLIHDPSLDVPQLPLVFDEFGIVYEIGSLSKVLAPALRIGYMIGPDGLFLHSVVQRTCDCGFSAPLVMQEVASYLLDHHIETQLVRVTEGYRQKAILVQQWITEQLGEFLADCSGGQAGFYFYLTFKDIETHEGSPFFRFLTRTTGQLEVDGPPQSKYPRVIYLPGEYCVHSKGQLRELGRRQLRLSYGFEELDRIAEGLRLMRQAALAARQTELESLRTGSLQTPPVTVKPLA